MPDFTKALYARLHAWISADEGQGLTEYALILAFVVIIAIVALSITTGKVTGALSTAGNSFNS